MLLAPEPPPRKPAALAPVRFRSSDRQPICKQLVLSRNRVRHTVAELSSVSELVHTSGRAGNETVKIVGGIVDGRGVELGGRLTISERNERM